MQRIRSAGILLFITLQKSPNSEYSNSTAAALCINKHGFGRIRSSRSVLMYDPWLLSSAKKLGVTEVPLEVVNFISHATQSRLRSLLEKVSAVAQHRTDGGKVRMAHSHVYSEHAARRCVGICLTPPEYLLPPSCRMKNITNKCQTFVLNFVFLSSWSELRNRGKTNKRERSC